MQIWVDADACPNTVKEILFRAAAKRRVRVTLVANHAVRTPPSPFIRAIQVPHGFDMADGKIAAELQPGDLVITADIPLAAEVIDRGGHAINPRGELYTTENVKERLAMRDVMDQLRSTRMISGGPPSLNQRDRQAFANQLDRFLTRQHSN